VSVELTLAIEAEIQVIEQDIEDNRTRYGAARAQKNRSYNTTGAVLMEQLQGYQMRNPAAEAARILWYVGVAFSSHAERIDPGARRTNRDGRWGDPLEGVARRRFVPKPRINKTLS